MLLTSHRSLRFAALALAFAPIGCGDDDDGQNIPENRTFVISQIVQDLTGFPSFAAFAPNLDAGTTIDPALSVELPDSSLLTRGPVPGSFLVSDGQSPQVRRFDIDANGDVTESGRVSFAGRGVTVGEIPPRVTVVSESKAYYLSEVSLLGFVFDPTELTITGEFSLEQIAAPPGPNNEVVLGVYPVVRGDFLLYPVLYRNLIEGSSEQLARVMFLDTRSDSIEVADDDRCGFLSVGIPASNGDVYYATDAFEGAMYAAVPNANSKGCILRIRDGEREFDPSYFVLIEDLVGTAVSGGFIDAGTDRAYLLAYDESIAPLGNTFLEVLGTPAWRTSLIELGDTIDRATLVEGIPPRSGAVSAITVDGVPYDSVTAADFSSTTLYRISAEGVPEEAITFPGFQFGVIRLD